MRIKQLECKMYVIVDKYGKQISGLMSKVVASHEMSQKLSRMKTKD